MMKPDTDRRFVLTQVSADAWAVHDLHFPEGDHQRLVCRVYRASRDVEVLWMRDLPLAPRYPSAEDVLQSVKLFQDAKRATRPIPIAHRPPPPLRRRRNG